jgi:RNA polymerase sigma-70 factor (ECF subfamily)
MLGFSNSENVRDASDEEVLERSQAEPWLFAVLLERYQDAFLRKARGILRDDRDAEEVVQDTFTKIYLNAGRFEVREGAKFSSWAYAILMNTAFTRYQKLMREGRRTVALDPAQWELQGARADHTGFAETADAIERILARLPGHFASVLRLHYLEHWSHKDIAEGSGETVSAVKARIHRAKAAFRKEEETLGERAPLL